MKKVDHKPSTAVPEYSLLPITGKDSPLVDHYPPDQRAIHFLLLVLDGDLLLLGDERRDGFALAPVRSEKRQVD